MKRVAMSLSPGDTVIDEDGIRRTVADVDKRDGTLFLAKEGATGDAATGSAFKLTPFDRVERNQPTTDQSARDLDEQSALEIVQEAVGLNKAQSRRLAELQSKNAALTSGATGAIKAEAAPETNTVGTAPEGTQAQRGAPRADNSPAITAEAGSNPTRSAAPLSPGLTEADGDLFKLVSEQGKIPAFLPDGIVKAQFQRLGNKLRAGGILSPKERAQYARLQQMFPDNYEDNWGVKGEKFRAAYEAAKRAGIAAEVFQRTNKAGAGALDDHLDFMRKLRGGTYGPDDLWGMVTQYANAFKERMKAESAEGQAKEDAKISDMQQQDEAFQQTNSRPGNGTVKIPIESLDEGDYYRLDGARIRVDTITHDDTGAVTGITLEDGSRFGTQHIERDASGDIGLRMDEGTLAKARHAAGDFNFDQAESVHDQKARQLAEKRKVDEAKAKAGMLDRAQARLTGEDVDTNQEMFGADVKTDKSGQQSMFAGGQERGMQPQPVTDAITRYLGTDRLPSGIRVVRDETAPWGAKIEGRNSIVVNAAQIGSEARARQVILEEGLHGVWEDPAVQRAWQSVRNLVTPDEMRAEWLRREAQGLPTDAETIREEATIARLIKADANRGIFARLYDVVRNVITRTFGVDLPATARQQLKAAAMEFLRNRDGWQGARGEFEIPPREQLGQQEARGTPGQQRLFAEGERDNDVIVEHVGNMGDIRVRTLDGSRVDFAHSETEAFDRASKMAAESGGRLIDNTRPGARRMFAEGDENKPVEMTLENKEKTRQGLARSSGFNSPQHLGPLSGQTDLPTNHDLGQGRFAAGDFPSSRPVAQIKAEMDDADADLKAKSAALTDPKAGTQAERKQAAAQSAARYRTLREELATHPDYVAEQILKQHQAITEANEILKPMGKTVRPDDFPNPSEVAEKLGPDAAQRVSQLADQISEANTELARTNRLAPKMADRITNQMMEDGRLPKMQPMADLGAGRTLDRMTQALKAGKIDSPKATLAERLAIGRRAADVVTGVKDFATRTGLRAQAMWRAGVESFKHPPTDDDYRTAKKSWIAYDQRTALENYQYAKALTDKVPLAIRRKAMSVWLDADGDAGLLKFQRDSVPEAYRPIWDAALKLTADEKRIALDVKANFAAKLDDAIDTGLVAKGREDYGVPQRWKTAPDIEQAAAGEEGKKGSPGNPYAKLDPRDPFFSFQRQTPSYFDGIMAKGVPENLDIAHLVTVYDAGFHKALGSRGWIAALQDAAGKDGLPVVKISGKASAANGEGGKAYFVDSKAHAPGDVTADGRPYKAIDHFALRDWKVAYKDEAGNPIIVRGDMLVHPDYFDDVKNELETPKWTQQGIGGAALKTSAFLKASKFVGPFHIVTEALHASFHGVVPSVHGFDIDLKDPNQALLSRNMSLGFGKAREMFEDGLSSHGGIWGHVPGLGDAVVRMNNFTFNEYIPRLKMKVGLAVLDRNMARYGKELTREQIAEVTGRQMDAAFGGQNWRLLGANKSTLAVMRLGLVAPDFLISRAKVIGQAFKPYNAEQRIFLLAQAVGVYAICRTLNATFSDDHDPHFEPRNWDSVVIGKRAYHARFIVSDAANLARDMMGLGGFSQHGIPFITGRLGVVPKTGIEALTGKDLFTGQTKDGLFQTDNPALKAFSIVAKDTAEWMTPMGVDGFMPGAAARGQTGLGSAIVATVGVSSKKESPANDVWNMARQFNLSSPDPKAVSFQKQRDNDTGTPSDYRALNNLLDAGQLDKAKAEVQALQSQGKTTSQIVSHYQRSTYFTGSAARETAFYASLTPGQQKTYQAAKAEQQARATALTKALAK